MLRDMAAARPLPSPALQRARALALALAAAGTTLPTTAQALCMASGAGCGEQATGARFLKAPTPAVKPFEIGQTLPADYQMLLNTARYGLPAPRDGWVYFRVEHYVLRVDLASRTVLADATSEANRAF